MKLIFTPISVISGLLAGVLAKKIFERAWALVDDEEPPQPEHREFSRPKLFFALVIEGAIFKLTKGLVNHATRSAFAKLTGSWPGEERPEAE